MTLLGKVLPLQVTGDGGGPVRVQAIDLSHLSDDDLDLLERIFGPLATADTHETVQ
jgi:hypothetical protein